MKIIIKYVFAKIYEKSFGKYTLDIPNDPKNEYGLQ